MKLIKVVVAVLVVGGVAAGAAKVFSGKAKRNVVREASLSRGDLSLTILATGTVQPENRVEIKSPVAGRVETVNVQEGQTVKKGQVLAWMSSSERAAIIDSARARGPEELKEWEEMYKPTPIVAPVDGTVILRSVESGQTFTTSDAVLVMSDRLTVQAAVDETDLAQIKTKQVAEIRLDAYPDDVVEAKVVRLAYEATTDNNVTTYKVYVLPNKTPAAMRSGMTANVTFFINQKKDVLLVENSDLKYQEGKPYVKVKDGEKERVQFLKLGVTDGKKSEVIAGLGEFDQYLVEETENKVAASEGSNPFGPPRPKARQGQAGPPGPP